MKIISFKSATFAFVIIFGSLVISAQDEVYVNNNAAANYDANLRPGGKAVAVLLGDLEEVSIVSKSGGVYKTLREGQDYEFRANSVYPYFDIGQFGEITTYGDGVLEAYLPCYAKKHNRELAKVTGDGYRPPYSVDISEMKTTLQAEQLKLAEIETRLKTLSARPDTFLPYDKNPAVWEDIAVNRAQYLQCALGSRQAEDTKNSPFLLGHKLGIEKVMKYVGNYQPGSRDSMGTDSEYAVYAVSQEERMEWLKKTNALDFKPQVDEMLKPLADALAEKLPSYQPRMEKFAFGTAADFALMKEAFTNSARYKIFKTGLMQNAWQIDKNVLGIPNARYKNGVFYLRDTQADHPYCYLTYVNIIQDYSGGGTYAASRAAFIKDELVACPAGN